MPVSKTQPIHDYLVSLQNKICHALQQQDATQHFQEDRWEHSIGGGGCTRVFSQGELFEQAGVNISHIHGLKLPKAATQKRPQLLGCRFQALGLSVVVHPRNPYVPTSHMNVRFFIAEKENAKPIWWFGGGYDLTPYYGFIEDCQHWHTTAKLACDPFGAEIYPHYKKWCDDYFYLQHRKEQRGIGGIFFDDLNEWPFDRCFAFMRAIGDSYLNAYLPIVERRKDMPYSDREREFQLYRRGRYVEFNLIYDRGTLFGLQSGGRTESILMSLPPKVAWHYQWQTAPGSEEARLKEFFLVPQEWV